jgi:hypothetical protein
MIRCGYPRKAGHVNQRAPKAQCFRFRYDITDERDIQADGERLARYLEQKAKTAAARQKGQKVRTLSWSPDTTSRNKALFIQ